MTVTFECGHEIAANGSENGIRCHCGETRIMRVNAPAPRFVGHCTGPQSQYNPALEAKPVVFEKDKNNA